MSQQKVNAESKEDSKNTNKGLVHKEAGEIIWVQIGLLFLEVWHNESLKRIKSYKVPEEVLFFLANDKDFYKIN